MVISLGILPALFEGVVVAALGRHFFGMTTSFSYALGFMMANLGTGVTLPSIYNIMQRGFKVNR